MQHHTAVEVDLGERGKGWHYATLSRRGGGPLGDCTNHPPHPTEAEARLLSSIATTSHSPGGWYGFTLGPPIFFDSRPAAESAKSRIISPSIRNRGPRESRRLSASFSRFSGVTTAD